MLGVTLAPGTGRAVTQLITGGDPGLDLTPFAPAPVL
jgi:glycine/D-amino acid oxidase-like deaminating enzyme